MRQRITSLISHFWLQGTAPRVDHHAVMTLFGFLQTPLAGALADLLDDRRVRLRRRGISVAERALDGVELVLDFLEL